MTLELMECEAQVLKLPVKERAILAERLITSLDSYDDSDNERLWVKEAEERYQQYKNGTITARLASDVLRDARLEIK